MNSRCLGAVGTVLCMLASAGAADADRGGALYENHCTGCHTSQAHIREARKADSPEALREWVQRWQRAQSLGWSAVDVEDVAAYLNARFYKFEPTAKQ